ncbi:hypothetical protein DW1_1627 [Proteiniborus sp. DW1]|uniref:ferrochelatase n=1 Tax=Proteiniborus sp. DW1 TaxID=1889883 RepID=UPI00092DFE1B|nr:ferrochelatase [Proteiniborus sp. DW1]SCG83197.1 hypothetical protein DW1_1627 [Proteiniborus sp. DW1]
MKKLIFFNKSLVYVFVFVFTAILFLVLDEPRESIFLILSTSTFLMMIKDRKKIFKVRPFLNFIIIFFLSYFISVILISTRGYTLKLMATGRKKDANGKAVLLVYEGEPEMYSFKKGIENININGTGKLFSPFILFENKRYYQSIGKSDYKKNTIGVATELQALLSNGFRVYLSYLYDTPYIEEALINIANDGYKDVIIAPVFLVDGHTSSVLKSRVEKMKLFNLNIDVKYIEPLWDSESLVNSYETIIRRRLNENNLGNTGILLIGEGQVGYNKNNFLNAVREDSMFRNRIRTKLIDGLGINEHKIKSGWFKYIEPNYLDAFSDLLDYNLGEIIVVYTKPSVTNIEIATIYKKITSKQDIPEGIKVTIIDGFLDDLLFIYELKNRIEFTNLQKWD